MKGIATKAAIAISTLAFSAFPVFAAVGNQNPQLTVQLTINPTVVTAPGQVTTTASITNNTGKTQRVNAEVEIVSPSGFVSEYYKNYTIAAGQTVSQTQTYAIGADAEKGVYTITLSAKNKNGTSSATEYLTVQ